MIRFSHMCKKMVSVFVALLFFQGVASCGGTETHDKVEKTVETLSGKDQIEQMNKMKEDIDKVKKIQAERLKQMD